MTPEDLAAIREQNGVTSASRTLALCAALEAAWAERDVYAKQRCTVVGHDIAMIEELRERAERAEREAHNARIQRDNAADDYIKADDALARVLALCDEAGCTLLVSKIRAAIEGDSQ